MEIIQGRKYLIKKADSDMVLLITVLTVTDTSIQIKRESGRIDWWTKKYLHDNYKIIEDVTDYNVYEKNPDNQFNTTYYSVKACSFCYGQGQVPDPTSTAGKKTCPFCGGAKYALCPPKVGQRLVRIVSL